MRNTSSHHVVPPAVTSLLAAVATVVLSASAPAEADRNILLVIMDDVGIDQIKAFNPLAPETAQTPILDAFAASSVKFTNCWAMPDCSPSRAAIFTGRYPLRTGVMSPCLPQDLPRSQVSPYEMTIARVLDDAGYDQHYVGKWHLGDPSLNPAGTALTWSVGFPSFDGTPYGGPAFIDLTLGGQMPAPSGAPVYSCGFPIDAKTNTPAVCSCAFPDGTWSDGVDALDCLTSGGVPLVEPDGTPILRGSAKAVALVDFSVSQWNGYFVMPRSIVQSPTAIDTVQRGYATTLDVDRGIDWLKAREGSSSPWFLTIGFEAIHTPYQQSPYALRAEGFEWPAEVPQLCGAQAGFSGSAIPSQRVLTTLMLEALDAELGRFLTATGIAEFIDGSMRILKPDTTIILVGDNGTYYPSVRFPYDPSRSKATVYQTGVLVPLAIAGAGVVDPGRSVDAMVNVVDLFTLIGELAGVDANAQVPRPRIVDGQPMLPYLVDPAAPQIRTMNFAQVGQNLHPIGVQFRPCLLEGLNTCTDGIFFSEALCSTEGGQWFGDFLTCCDLLESGRAGSDFSIVALGQAAVTDGRWKLVYNEVEACVTGATYEFYDLAEAPFAELLGGRGIDYAQANLLGTGRPLTPVQQAAFERLLDELDGVLASEVPCPGDGNLDKRVDARDILDLFDWWGPTSSVYDFNGDLMTDGADLGVILSNWDRECLRES